MYKAPVCRELRFGRIGCLVIGFAYSSSRMPRLLGEPVPVNFFSKADSTKIKGFAMLMMLMHHLYCEVNRFDGYSVSFTPFSQDFVVGLSLAFKICVSLFAFISGYGLLASYRSLQVRRDEMGGGNGITEWIAKHLVKLLSNFLFIYILCFVVTLLINGLPIQTYFSGSKIAGALYMGIDACGLAGLFRTPTLCATWWYISAAIIYIAVLPVIANVRDRYGWIPVLAGYIATPRLLNIGYPGGVNPYTFLLPVIFGMMAFDMRLFQRMGNLKCAHLMNENCKTGPGSPSLFAIFGAICVLSVRLFFNVPAHEMWELEYGFVPVLVIIFLKYGVIGIPGVSRALFFLGEHSMTMFLTHTFIRYVYLRDVVYSNGNFISNFLVLLLLSVALAWFIDAFKNLISFNRVPRLLCDKIENMGTKISG